MKVIKLKHISRSFITNMESAGCQSLKFGRLLKTCHSAVFVKAIPLSFNAFRVPPTKNYVGLRCSIYLSEEGFVKVD